MWFCGILCPCWQIIQPSKWCCWALGALSSHGLFGLAHIDIEKLISALEIPGGSKTDACTHAWNLWFSLRGIQFIKDLTVWHKCFQAWHSRLSCQQRTYSLGKKISETPYGDTNTFIHNTMCLIMPLMIALGSLVNGSVDFTQWDHSLMCQILRSISPTCLFLVVVLIIFPPHKPVGKGP